MTYEHEIEVGYHHSRVGSDCYGDCHCLCGWPWLVIDGSMNTPNVYFSLYRSRGSLEGVDPVRNNYRCVIRSGKGSYKSINAESRAIREVGIMRGQIGTLTYDCVSDIDEMARSGDRVKLEGAIFDGDPVGIFAGRWFVIDNGTPNGWQVRAGLQEMAGAVDVGMAEGPGEEQGGVLVLDGTDGDLILDGTE